MQARPTTCKVAPLPRRNNLELAPSPVNGSALEQLLIGYPNPKVADMLIEGFSNGFSLKCDNPPVMTFTPKNLKSIQLNPLAAAEKIKKEVNLGRFSGPWKTSPIPDLIITPIGLVEKKVKGTFRLIHHLSWPRHGHSVNSGIDRKYCIVKYNSFDSAIEMIAKKGKYTLLWKEDVISAFSTLSLRKEDFRLTGFKFEGGIYIEKCMPMGAAVSCATWEAFANFIQWRVQLENNTSNMSFYVDDFIFFGAYGTNECHSIIAKFQEICKKLGVPLAEDKRVGPCHVINYLGYTIDTVNGMVKVPCDRVYEALQKRQELINSRKATKGFLESLYSGIT